MLEPLSEISRASHSSAPWVKIVGWKACTQFPLRVFLTPYFLSPARNCLARPF